MRRFCAPAGLIVALLTPSPAKSQFDVTGYSLGVGTYQGESDLGPSGSTLLGRTRLMLNGTKGSWGLDVAYEHVLSRTPASGGFSITTPGGSAARSGDWLGADWEIHSSERNSWRHRLDRLSVTYSEGPVEVTMGRQAVSWATTLFLTPADPFAPFDPSDPFREYRGGIDAARIRAYPGPFTEIEAVVRPTETVLGTTWTALGRAQTSLNGWAFGAWGGMLHDEAAGAVFATGALGATAVRGEASLRKNDAGGTAVRGALGLDRFFTPGGKDLYVIVEFQYDEFAAESASTLLDVVASKPYLRGEIQTLGRVSFVSQTTYQIHPIISVDMMGLINLDDHSMLFAPGISWSASGSASVRLGTFAGLGEGLAGPAQLGSEYGAVPGIGYLSVTWYF
jgi:hypothetical protein